MMPSIWWKTKATTAPIVRYAYITLCRIIVLLVYVCVCVARKTDMYMLEPNVIYGNSATSRKCLNTSEFRFDFLTAWKLIGVQNHRNSIERLGWDRLSWSRFLFGMHHCNHPICTSRWLPKSTCALWNIIYDCHFIALPYRSTQTSQKHRNFFWFATQRMLNFQMFKEMWSTLTPFTLSISNKYNPSAIDIAMISFHIVGVFIYYYPIDEFSTRTLLFLIATRIFRHKTVWSTNCEQFVVLINSTVCSNELNDAFYADKVFKSVLITLLIFTEFELFVCFFYQINVCLFVII